jgi:hypothetical protein
MVPADSGQPGDLFLGEDFLTRLDSDHFLPCLGDLRPWPAVTPGDESAIVKNLRSSYKPDKCSCNSISVSFSSRLDKIDCL